MVIEKWTDMDKKKAYYDISNDTRKFEIELFWRRSLFFWGFIASAFAFLGFFYSERGLSLVISGFGLIGSLSWTLANRGSKYWFENWEKKVRKSENEITGKLFGDPEPEPKYESLLKTIWHGKIWDRRRYSVSKLAIALSDYVTILWILIFINILLGILGFPYPVALRYKALLITIITLIWIKEIFRVTKGKTTFDEANESMNDEECTFCKLIYSQEGELKDSPDFEKYQIIENCKDKNWICVFDKYPLTPGHILIIYKPENRDSSHKPFYEIEDDFNDFYTVLETWCNRLEGKKVKKEYPHVKLNLFSLNAIGMKKDNERKGHLHFHIIPEYKPEFDEELEWHRMYPTKEVGHGLWYFGYREYKRNKEKTEVEYGKKIKEEIEKIRKLMGLDS